MADYLACAVVCILSLRNNDLTDKVSIRKLLCERQSAWWLTLYGSLRAVFSALSVSKIASITPTVIPDRGVELLRYARAGIPTIVQISICTHVGRPYNNERVVLRDVLLGV